MKRGNLLRHIFRYGPHSKFKQDTLLSKTDERDGSSPVIKPAADASKVLSQDPLPPRTPEPPAVHVLPEITEETSPGATGSPSISSSTGSTVSDLASVVTVLASHAPVIDPTTLTARDLLYAAIDEATSATNGHLDTLETTLALLGALTGFSATIEVLKQEMEDKKRACEAKLVELEGFEEAVEGMDFSDWQQGVNAEEVSV
jgi:hypothetical protein